MHDNCVPLHLLRWHTMVNNPSADAGDQETLVWSLGWDDPLENMATHSRILAWRVPRTEEPGRPHSHRLAKSQTRLKWLSTHACTQHFLVQRTFFATSVRFIHKHFVSLYTILNGIFNFNFKLFTGIYTNTLDLDIVVCCNLTKLTYSSSRFVEFLEFPYLRKSQFYFFFSTWMHFLFHDLMAG